MATITVEIPDELLTKLHQVDVAQLIEQGLAYQKTEQQPTSWHHVHPKIMRLERELQTLRYQLWQLKTDQPAMSPDEAPLEGLWVGVDISDEEIEMAKQSLFGKYTDAVEVSS